MALWSIADLHLSLARPDRRERYAARWLDHAQKIEAQWREAVKRDDLVLLAGRPVDGPKSSRPPARPGLARPLAGDQGALAAGNHDAWWNGVEAIRPMLRRSLLAVGGRRHRHPRRHRLRDARRSPVLVEDEADPTLIASASEAELAALDQRLSSMRRASSGSTGEPLYVLWHYPPFDQHRRPGPCVDRFEAAGVSACVYGHIHIQGQWSMAVQGDVRGVRYHCVAADAIGFRPLRLDRPPVVSRR